MNTTLPINLSYEIDLWGMLRSNYQSAIYNAESQEDAFLAALLILTTDLADSYFRLRMFDAEIDLFLETIQTRRKAVEITTARYEGKVANYSDVSRAAFELSNVEANYYDALRKRNLEEDRIAVLIGAAASEFTIPHNPLQGDPPYIPEGVPSDVLLQRPDLAQLERTRASEQAQIRVAYAAFFPSLTLTGAFGYSSPDFRVFLDWISRFWALGANAAQTIFDGGAKSSNLDLAIANYKEADFQYQQQVLIAFQEVEDALTSVELLAKESNKLAHSVASAKTTLQIARDRYLQGITFYLEVTDSERDALNSQRIYLETQGLRYSATIQLIKALGGSWNRSFYSVPSLNN